MGFLGSHLDYGTGGRIGRRLFGLYVSNLATVYVCAFMKLHPSGSKTTTPRRLPYATLIRKCAGAGSLDLPVPMSSASWALRGRQLSIWDTNLFNPSLRGA